MQAKQTMPVITAMSVKRGRPWGKHPVTSWFGSCAEDGQQGLPSAPLALKSGVLAKQNVYWGI